MNRTTGGNDLRSDLRGATMPLHETLDRGMARFDLTDAAGYAGFLAIQYHARIPIEAWVRRACPPDLAPPAQSHLIEADLVALGVAVPADADRPPFDAAEPIGVAWALAGSSLGNRAMLAQLRKRVGDDWPVAFLADPAMPEFWRTLRPRLELEAAPETVDGAIAAAAAVFHRFLDALELRTAKEPA